MNFSTTWHRRHLILRCRRIVVGQSHMHQLLGRCATVFRGPCMWCHRWMTRWRHVSSMANRDPDLAGAMSEAAAELPMGNAKQNKFSSFCTATSRSRSLFTSGAQRAVKNKPEMRRPPARKSWTSRGVADGRELSHGCMMSKFLVIGKITKWCFF